MQIPDTLKRLKQTFIVSILYGILRCRTLIEPVGSNFRIFRAKLIKCPNNRSFIIWGESWENLLFAYATTKGQITCAVTVQLIITFVLLYRYSQSPTGSAPACTDLSPLANGISSGKFMQNTLALFVCNWPKSAKIHNSFFFWGGGGVDA